MNNNDSDLTETNIIENIKSTVDDTKNTSVFEISADNKSIISDELNLNKTETNTNGDNLVINLFNKMNSNFLPDAKELQKAVLGKFLAEN